jgi:hypothetical protein
VEQTKILLEATSSPRGKEGYLLSLHKELGQYFDLFFKYNQVPDDVRRETLAILANWGFESAESSKTAALMIGQIFTSGGATLNQEINERRRTELLQIMHEDMVKKITYISDTRALFPEMLQVWKSGDQLATYLKENSAPLEPRQVCDLVDILTEAKANTPVDDSVFDAIGALFTIEQMEQFKNYREEEVLLNETRAIDKKTERRINALISKRNTK